MNIIEAGSCPDKRREKLLIRVVPAVDGVHSAAVNASQLGVVLGQPEREKLARVDRVAFLTRQRAKILHGILRFTGKQQLLL